MTLTKKAFGNMVKGGNTVTSLKHDRLLDLSKLRAFTDNKLNMVQFVELYLIGQIKCSLHTVFCLQ